MTELPNLFTFDAQPPRHTPVPTAAQEGERPRRSEGSARRASPEELLEGLNPPQREAVLHAGSPVLVVAGAVAATVRAKVAALCGKFPVYGA